MTMTTPGMCFELQDVSKTYRPQGRPVVAALRPLTIGFPWGARIAILGHSGAGKSTLMHLPGLLDEADPTAESDLVYWDGQTSWRFQGCQPLGAADRDRLRRQQFGFVFQ